MSEHIIYRNLVMGFWEKNKTQVNPLKKYRFNGCGCNCHIQFCLQPYEDVRDNREIHDEWNTSNES
jgi:hypothetical protein